MKPGEVRLVAYVAEVDVLCVVVVNKEFCLNYSLV